MERGIATGMNGEAVGKSLIAEKKPIKLRSRWRSGDLSILLHHVPASGETLIPQWWGFFSVLSKTQRIYAIMMRPTNTSSTPISTTMYTADKFNLCANRLRVVPKACHPFKIRRSQSLNLKSCPINWRQAEFFANCLMSIKFIKITNSGPYNSPVA